MISQFMNKKLLILMLIVMLMLTTLSGFTTTTQAQNSSQTTKPQIDSYTDKWAVIMQTDQSPELDGNLDEPIWENAATLNGFKTAYYNHPAESDTNIMLTYDEQNLYIGVSHEDHSDSLANLDFMISPDIAGEQYYETSLEVSDPGHSIVNDWGPGKRFLDNVTSEMTKQGQTITAEISIPFTAFGVDHVTPGDEWGFNVIAQHHMDTKPLSSWVPIRTSSYFSSSNSTTISMYANVADEGRMGSIFFSELPHQAEPWQPNDYDIAYTSFTEKELSFQQGHLDPQQTSIKLGWKAPNRPWEDLNQVQSSHEDDRFIVNFQHPEPLEKGTYALRVNISQHDESQTVILTFDQFSLIEAGNTLFAENWNEEIEKTPVTPAPPSDEVEALLDLIPDKIGFRTVGLPDNPDLRPIDVYSWSPSNPEVLTSPYSDLTYPNELYPEDQVYTVYNAQGEPVDYPYYEDEDGKRYFISANLWYHQLKYVAGQLPGIAEQDPLGAARLLHRFAEVYQGYVITHERDWKIHPISPASGPPYPYYGGNAWYWWSPAALADLRFLADAYAIVKQTDAFDVLSEEVGKDVETFIVEDMFEPSVDYARSFPILNTNMDSTNWLGLTDLGQALNDPSYIHDAVKRVEDYVMNTYLFDGFFKETTLSYHLQSTGGLDSAIRNLAGWSDPEGYISPRSGTHLNNLNMREKFPALQKSQEIPQLLAYPNGKYLPTQDTWAFQETNAPSLDAGSFLLPASGIARLARGTLDEVDIEYGTRYSFNDLEMVEATLDTRYMESRDALLFRNNQGPGHHITFAFEVEQSAEYEIALQAFKATSYGIYDIKINGESVGEQNFYVAPNAAGDFETIAESIFLEKGTHQITFENVGKDEASSDFYMALMYLMLLDEQDQEDRDEVNRSNPDAGDPTQLYLTFQTKYGHDHHDSLNLTLFDEGQELLPDIGYTHTFYRQWTGSTLAHNLVVVDGQDSQLSGEARNGGNIEVFAPNHGAVQVVRAQANAAYAQTDEYSREPWMIQFPDTTNNEGYVLDIFRVSGGDRHEYTLQGDANHDGTFETDLPLSEYGPYLLPEGVEVQDPVDQYDDGSAEGHYYGYIYVRDVQKSELVDEQYDLTLVTEEDGQAKSNLYITGLVEPGQNALFIGKSPSLRATRLYGTSMDNNNEAVKYMMPKMVLRREGNDLTSQFITALEPYADDGTPRIEHIERLTPDQSTEGDVAVKITYGDTTDIILSSLQPEQPLVVGDITLQGKMGMIRIMDGEVQDMYLYGGTLLEKGNIQVTDEGPISGTITDVHRIAANDGQDAFVTNTPVPAEHIGNTIVITHPDGKTHGYKIKEISTSNDQTVIHTDEMDPGFTIRQDGTSSMNFFPFTAWTGETTFRIENAIQGAERQEIKISMIQERVAHFENEGALGDDQAVRAIKTHLTAVEVFENQEAGEKIVQHMESFLVLLDHQHKHDEMSDEAYQTLQSDAKALMKQWQ